jgi:glycosyltransferase involved in cell wall biosynthesis
VRSAVRTVIGVTLYNGEAHVEEALESLLAQTASRYSLVLVDDCSSDATVEIARRYLRHKVPVHLEVNAHRLGMVANWRRAFDLARELHPGFDYFAWGSDHDVWHPRWLATLVETLDASPEAVMAYPHAIRISGDGALIGPIPAFETRGMTDARARLAKTFKTMPAGSMVYGLMRPSALAASGVFRSMLIPDRMLMAEISLRGEIHQVHETLWYRRFKADVSHARQRASFFPNGSPWHTYLPWWIVHPAALAWNLLMGHEGEPAWKRSEALFLAASYGRRAVVLEAHRRFRVRLVKPARRRARRWTKRVQRSLRNARAAGMTHELRQPVSRLAAGAAAFSRRVLP